MSEQSLFRRSAPYKPYSGSQKNDITLSGVFFCVNENHAIVAWFKKGGSMSNVGVRIIKFHNTIFSDIKICLLAEA